MVEVGVFITFNSAIPPERNIALAQAAEERGFAALWVPEHVLFFEQYASRYPYSEDGKITGLNLNVGIMDPFIALTWLAAHTKKIRLGTAVALVPQREPIYTAKVVADLDYLSGGRVNLGIGVGWLKEEFDALRIPFADRGKRTRECIKVMQTLWCDEISQHKGELFNLPPSLQNPKPIQKPHPPMFFGGESEPALKRVAEIGQGWLGAGMMPEEMPAKLKRLDQLLADAGRSRKDIKVYIGPLPAQINRDPDRFRRYEDVGVEQVVQAVTGRTLDDQKARLDEMAKQARIAA